VHVELAYGLERLRTLCCEINGGRDTPIDIRSGFRCVKHNNEVRGSVKSQHTLGLAADIMCDDVAPEVLAMLAESVAEFKWGGIGVYEVFVHVDVRRDGPVRWNMLCKKAT
jgi:uncharacterized protein YcbK (DUF882 family)